MLYQEIKKEILKTICIDVNEENSHQVHMETFRVGLSNGLSNQEAIYLADDILYLTENKSKEEINKMGLDMEEPLPDKITWVNGNGVDRPVPSKEGRRFIFHKINEFIREFQVYNNVEVCSGNYDCTNIEIGYKDSDTRRIEDFYKKEKEELKKIKSFIENELELEIDEEECHEGWTIDEHWGDRYHETWFIIGSAYKYF